MTKPVFTIGHRKNYDRGLKRYGRDFKKVGRTADYPGGYAFTSPATAMKRIDELHKVGVYAIYELEADLDKDTVPSDNGWWRALIRDAVILRRVTHRSKKRCDCPDRCRICGSKLRQDSVGHLCPTKNCQFEHGYENCLASV